MKFRMGFVAHESYGRVELELGVDGVVEELLQEGKSMKNGLLGEWVSLSSMQMDERQDGLPDYRPVTEMSRVRE